MTSKSFNLRPNNSGYVTCKARLILNGRIDLRKIESLALGRVNSSSSSSSDQNLEELEKSGSSISRKRFALYTARKFINSTVLVNDQLYFYFSRNKNNSNDSLILSPNMEQEGMRVADLDCFRELVRLFESSAPSSQLTTALKGRGRARIFARISIRKKQKN